MRDTACRQVNLWRDQGLAPPTISINVSGAECRSAELEREVKACFDRWKILPNDIEFEITGPSIVEASQRRPDLLANLRYFGAHIAIDEFGTGYSSVEYLRKHMVDRIKIVQKFILTAPSDTGNAALVRAILSMARDLDLATVGKGAETRAQIDFFGSGRLSRRAGVLPQPSHGRTVQLQVTVRRFRCPNSGCPRRFFAEPLRVAGRSARRTMRLEAIVHHLGVALGGRPAAALAKRLMLPASKDTLLRVVRRHAVRDSSLLRVIGIDDWAWKRGQRYGSVICDLERRRIVDLLPDREPSTVEAWLSRRPEIRVIARDRGGGYGQAATRAAPQAMQVADRWHLMENASAAFLEVVRRSMRAIRVALGSVVIDPALLTHAERLQHEGYLRREEAHEAIRTLAKAATPIKEIVRRTGRSRKLVREIVRGGGGDVFRCRSNILQPHLAWLDVE